MGRSDDLRLLVWIASGMANWQNGRSDCVTTGVGLSITGSLDRAQPEMQLSGANNDVHRSTRTDIYLMATLPRVLGDVCRSVEKLPSLRITFRCETVSSLLTYKDQGFWVSNGINDDLYKILVAMTRNDHPDVFGQLESDESLMGGRFVGGLGFAFEDFERIFGGAARFEEIARSKWVAIDDVCQNEQCSKIMQKVFRWAFWMMDGGRCNYDLKPYASWRTRCRALIYCCSLGFIDVAPDRSEHPLIHELADEPPPDGHRSVQ